MYMTNIGSKSLKPLTRALGFAIKTRLIIDPLLKGFIMNTEEQYFVATILAGLTIGVLVQHTVSVRTQHKVLNNRIKVLKSTVASQKAYIDYLNTRYKYV